jgi:hypothetical protein
MTKTAQGAIACIGCARFLARSEQLSLAAIASKMEVGKTTVWRADLQWADGNDRSASPPRLATEQRVSVEIITFSYLKHVKVIKQLLPGRTNANFPVCEVRES